MPYSNPALTVITRAHHLRHITRAEQVKELSRIFGDEWRDLYPALFTENSLEKAHQILLLNKNILSPVGLIRMINSMGQLEYASKGERLALAHEFALGHDFLNRMKNNINESIHEITNDIEKIMQLFGAFLLKTDTLDDEASNEAFQKAMENLNTYILASFDDNMPEKFKSKKVDEHNKEVSAIHDVVKLMDDIQSDANMKLQKAKDLVLLMIREKIKKTVVKGLSALINHDITSMHQLFENEFIHSVSAVTMSPYFDKDSLENSYINVDAIYASIMDEFQSTTNSIFEITLSDPYYVNFVKKITDLWYRSLCFGIDGQDPDTIALCAITQSSVNRLNNPYPTSNDDPTQTSDAMEMALMLFDPSEHSQYERMVKYTYCLARAEHIDKVCQMNSELLISRELDTSKNHDEILMLNMILHTFSEEVYRLNSKITEDLSKQDNKVNLKHIDHDINRILNLTLHAKQLIDIINRLINKKSHEDLYPEVIGLLKSCIENDQKFHSKMQVTKSTLEKVLQEHITQLQPQGDQSVHTRKLSLYLHIPSIHVRHKSNSSNSSTSQHSSNSNTPGNSPSSSSSNEPPI